MYTAWELNQEQLSFLCENAPTVYHIFKNTTSAFVKTAQDFLRKASKIALQKFNENEEFIKKKNKQ